MYVRCVALLVNLFLFSMLASSQDHKGLSQAERIVLDNPEVIMLEFALNSRRPSEDIYEKMAGPFKPASRIQFNLMGTNTSLIEVAVRRWDTYAQNKPRLLRDNQELAYREEIAELIKEKHTKDSESISVRRIKLNPNDPKVLETLNLADWYGPLGPGHYELSTQHRFVQCGKWVESAAIVFEVKNIEE